MAPLADPWSKKVELKEDLEVLLPYYDTIRYDKFHLTPRQRRQNRDLTKNRLVQDILKKTYSVWTVDAVSWIRE